MERDLVKVSVPLKGVNPVLILGIADSNLAFISKFFSSQIIVRNDRVRIRGPRKEVEEIKVLFQNLIKRLRRGETLDQQSIKEEIERVKSESQVPSEEKGGLAIHTPKKVIYPKTEHQKEYLLAIDEYEIVIAIGPAGTGKTYLAVAKAISYLLSGKVERIILTRPAVEAGESLGYLPGDFREKVSPYLRPLYDALFDMLPIEKAKRLIDEEIVEVAPLAYMRGRTLSDAFIILDEGQNTTQTQMKMFLTRLGYNSKAIVTGDITQIDLGTKAISGLVDARTRLGKVSGVKIVYFDQSDVTRPPIVSRIIRAYEE
uniref:PhoH-like protein n=1 Tax=candidate division WOR-3 bacterium TaxID=2052148 RepID=A0A7C3Z1J5_UNCW3